MTAHSLVCGWTAVDSLVIICSYLTALSLERCQISDAGAAKVLVGGTDYFKIAEYIVP